MIAQRLEIKGSKNGGACSRSEQSPVDRPIDPWTRPVDRPVDRCARRAQHRNGRPPCKPWRGMVDRGEVWSTARSTDWNMAALGWCRSTRPVDRVQGSVD